MRVDRGAAITMVVAVMTLPVDAQRMYWADKGSHKVQRANLDGSNVEDLAALRVFGLPGLAFDPSAGKVYWADTFAETIMRANKDGSPPPSSVSRARQICMTKGLRQAYKQLQ